MTDSYEVNDNNAAQALDYNQHSARWQYSVQNGCAVSINSGTLGQSDTLSVASGDIFFNGNSVSVSSQNVQIDASDSEPRKDVVYLDSTGSATVSKGAAEQKTPSGATRFDAYRPAPNDLTGTDTTIIAEVWVPGGASSITASDLRDRRQFADMSVKSLTANETHTKSIGANDYHYAGDFDGSDPDSRLGNALSTASEGDVIYLENGLYKANRTYSQRITLIGSRPPKDTVGTRLGNYTWTFDARANVIGVGGDSLSQITLNAPTSQLSGLNTDLMPVQVNANQARIVDSHGLDITFASGTDKGVADSLTNSTVTDNGTNTVGDIS